MQDKVVSEISSVIIVQDYFYWPEMTTWMYG